MRRFQATATSKNYSPTAHKRKPFGAPSLGAATFEFFAYAMVFGGIATIVYLLNKQGDSDYMDRSDRLARAKRR